MSHGICVDLYKLGAMWHLVYMAPRFRHMPRGICLGLGATWPMSKPMCHVSYIGAMWHRSKWVLGGKM